MFDLFRSRRKVVQYALGALLLLVAISMVVTLVPGFGVDMGGSPSAPVAEIGDDVITQIDVRRNLQNALQAQQISREMIPLMLPQMIDGMVTQRALALQARRLGFRVTEKEVAELIQAQLPFLFENGKFVGNELYAQVLAQQGLTIEEFERRVRQDILVGKLRQLVQDSVVVSPREIEQRYRANNEQVRLAYVEFTPDKLKTQVRVSEDEVRKYYEERKPTFRVPETRTFEVLTLDQETVAARLDVSDAEIERAYNEQKDRFRSQEQRRARHILIPTTGKSEEEKKAARAKAEDLLRQLKSGADFAKLATEHSEDPGSAAQGGDLGFITRGQMVPAFEQAVFSLKPNELSGIVETTYGYHIVQVTEAQEARLKPLAEVREQLISEAKRQKVFEQIQSTADAARAELAANPGQAQQIADKYGMKYAKIGPKQPNNTFDEIGAGSEVSQVLFATPKGQVTPVFQADQNKLAIAVVNEVTDARQAELAEVAPQIRTALETNKVNELIAQRAKQAFEAAKGSGNLEQIARANNLQVKTTQPFNRTGAADGIGSAALLMDAFAASEGAVLGPISSGNSHFLVKVIEKLPADMTQIAAQRAQLAQQIRQSKAQSRIEIFEDQVRERLIEDGDVKIYQEVINRLAQSFKS